MQQQQQQQQQQHFTYLYVMLSRIELHDLVLLLRVDCLLLVERPSYNEEGRAATAPLEDEVQLRGGYNTFTDSIRSYSRSSGIAMLPLAHDLGRAATPPLEEEEEEEEIGLRAKSTTFNHCSCNDHQLDSAHSESSATAMLSSTHGLRQSVSVSDLENRPPSTNLETWMSVSDEHLLISPTGGKASSSSSSVNSQAKEAHLTRSLSS
ncbi:unnamed protein product [Taenia asiatica]|uniref:Uncharacterized protein n=1 Tax=Taenia asiatica TaxID=60517 RepID=A0A3P6PD51_TAEAS|nr:unnamed protein product [Taenia asiatica]